MSSVFEVLFFFLLVKIYVLSSWDEINVCVKLLADYLWAAEDDKKVFLIVVVDTIDPLYLKERPISLSVVPMSTIKRKYDKLG